MPRRKVISDGGRSNETPTRRSTRRATAQDDAVPDIYKEMLAEAQLNDPDEFQQTARPAKRRKIIVDDEPESIHNGQQEQVDPSLAIPSPTPSVSSAQATAPIQTIFNNDFDDSDSDSDIEFEDVDIDHPDGTDSEAEEPKSLQIDLSASTVNPRKVVQRRKPVTKAERDFRLDVHKWHLLCLLIHQASRNKWCDDETVQNTLKPLISRKLISRVHREGTQAERKVAFDQSIEEICQIWKMTWKITARGIRRAIWREHIDLSKEVEEADDPIDLEDFQNAAKECSGSRDLGAQLFCALLRSIAVETRLVFSFQVFPFSRVAKGETPQKAGPSYIQAGHQDYGTGRSVTMKKKKAKKIVDSPYPIWWVEAFNPAIDQWIPLDPLVRDTVNRPRSGFEPASSDSLNAMSYVIAFEDDGTAKDVTKRYTSAYNAKTRKTRVESTRHGQSWYAKVIGFFSKAPELRDEIENAALDRRIAQEGMPKNVQDFKDHPVYVLERHLRSNEVIEPRRECGKFTVGKNQKVESVYRRSDVHACRSADGWYRKGRDVRIGEQPLKRVPKRRNASLPPDDEDDEVDEGVALYAEFQTDIYTPPAIVGGLVPRNGYGNLDVYVPSMIPARGVHLRHPLAAQAASILGIDAADAVTGFKFKGRQGTAIIDGVVVDEQYTAAVIATTSTLENELDDEVNAQRSAILASVWKKMHAVLSVRQRLREDYGGFAEHESDTDDDDDPTYNDDAGGGFVADSIGEATKESQAEETANLNALKDRQPVVLPPPVIRQQVVVVRSPHKVQVVHEDTSNAPDAKDDLFDSNSEGGGFDVATETDLNIPSGGGFVAEDDNEAGGFLPDEGQEAGGFIVEDQEPQEHADEADGTSSGLVSKVERNLNIEQALDESHNGHSVVPEEGGSVQSIPTETKPISISSAPLPQGGHRPSNTAVRNETSPPPGSQQNGQSIPSTQTSNSSKRSKGKGKGKTTAAKSKSYSRSGSETSMLSHDPNEDDAEMQWVEDAFEDDF